MHYIIKDIRLDYLSLRFHNVCKTFALFLQQKAWIDKKTIKNERCKADLQIKIWGFYNPLFVHL